MPRYAQVENGIVINVIVATPEVAQARGLILADGASPGWSFDGIIFSPPPEPPKTPEEIAREADGLARKNAREALKNAPSKAITVKDLEDIGLL